MRTTLNLDDELLTMAKTEAARSGRTLTSVIEDALRAALARHEDAVASIPYQVRPFDGDGLRGGVDLDDSAALHEVMDGRE